LYLRSRIHVIARHLARYIQLNVYRLRLLRLPSFIWYNQASKTIK
jgi:hypothetical protein